MRECAYLQSMHFRQGCRLIELPQTYSRFVQWRLLRYIKIKMNKFNAVPVFIKHGLCQEFCPEPNFKTNKTQFLSSVPYKKVFLLPLKTEICH